jgi:hypothetical protein
MQVQNRVFGDSAVNRGDILDAARKGGLAAGFFPRGGKKQIGCGEMT